jgi:hypothetical protein
MPHQVMDEQRQVIVDVGNQALHPQAAPIESDQVNPVSNLVLHDAPELVEFPCQPTGAQFGIGEHEQSLGGRHFRLQRERQC